jgi:hypothetical protein
MRERSKIATDGAESELTSRPNRQADLVIDTV